MCLNYPRYIKKNDLGKNILTDYALDQVDECCFVFERKISAGDSYTDTYYCLVFLDGGFGKLLAEAKNVCHIFWHGFQQFSDGFLTLYQKIFFGKIRQE